MFIDRHFGCQKTRNQSTLASFAFKLELAVRIRSFVAWCSTG